MKKILLGALCILVVFMLSSCGLFEDADTNTVYVKKDGTIIGTSVESFDKDYYDEDGLESFTNEKIDAYVSDNGKGTVKLKEFKVEDSSAKVQIEYKSMEDYSAFNDVEFFAGTIADAMEAGYDFSVEFCEVSDDKLGEVVNTDDVINNEDYKVVITEEYGDIRTSGDILFVASYDANMSDDKVVTISKDQTSDMADSEKELTYVIYK